MSDPFGLQRFVDAQAPVYEAVRSELKAGRKQSHWMWFVFPQIAGLGTSPTAVRYALSSLDEARAYLAHPVLGERLRECAGLVLGVEGRSALQIFGSIDATKFRSCLTLFEAAAPRRAAVRGLSPEVFRWGARSCDACKALKLAPSVGHRAGTPAHDACLRPAPSARDRAPESPRNRGAARSRGRGGRHFAAGREEAHHAAGPNADQPVLRGLDPHPILLRTCRKAARRGRHEHGGRRLELEEGRDAHRHRDDPERDAARHSRRAAQSGGRGASARPQGRLLGHQRRRRGA